MLGLRQSVLRSTKTSRYLISLVTIVPDFNHSPQSDQQFLPQPVPQPLNQRNPNSRQPSFQRIRINKPLPQTLSLAPTTQSPLSSVNEGSSLRFQRVIGLDRLPETSAPLISTPSEAHNSGRIQKSSCI